MRPCEIARRSLLPQLRAHAEEVSGRRARDPPRDPYGDPRSGGEGIFSPFYHWGTAGLGGPQGSLNSGAPLALLGLPPALPAALGLKEDPTRSPGSGHGQSDKIEGEGPPCSLRALSACPCVSHPCLSCPQFAKLPSRWCSPPRSLALGSWGLWMEKGCSTGWRHHRASGDRRRCRGRLWGFGETQLLPTTHKKPGGCWHPSGFFLRVIPKCQPAAASPAWQPAAW